MLRRSVQKQMFEILDIELKVGIFYTIQSVEMFYITPNVGTCLLHVKPIT